MKIYRLRPKNSDLQKLQIGYVSIERVIALKDSQVSRFRDFTQELKTKEPANHQEFFFNYP